VDGGLLTAFGPPAVAETGEPRRLLLELLLLLFMLWLLFVRCREPTELIDEDDAEASGRA
jgi:hypothetical protein